MKQPKLVIFDCDGVLVDSETITNAVMVSLLKEYNVNLSREEYVRRYVGITLEDCRQRIANDFDVHLPTTFVPFFYEKAMEALELDLVEIPGVRDLIERINLPCCVASNSHDAKLKMMLEKTQLLHYFGNGIFSSTHVPNYF